MGMGRMRLGLLLMVSFLRRICAGAVIGLIWVTTVLSLSQISPFEKMDKHCVQSQKNEQK